MPMTMNGRSALSPMAARPRWATCAGRQRLRHLPARSRRRLCRARWESQPWPRASLDVARVELWVHGRGARTIGLRTTVIERDGTRVWRLKGLTLAHLVSSWAKAREAWVSRTRLDHSPLRLSYHARLGHQARVSSLFQIMSIDRVIN
jgi:hypothetical protein